MLILIGSLVIAIAVSAYLLRQDLVSIFLGLAERYISPDNEVGLYGQMIIDKSISLMIVSLLILGFLFLILSHKDTSKKFYEVLFRDIVCGYRGKLVPLSIFISTIVVGLVLSFSYKYSKLHTVVSKSPIYKEDGPFETITAVIFVVSAFIMLKAFFVFRRSTAEFESDVDKKFGPLVIIGLACALFIVGMEEISWGQRFFGWETPEFMERVNLQKETNLHNVFYNYFDMLYPVASIALMVIAATAIFIRWHGSCVFSWNVLLPHPCSIFLVFLIVLFSFPPFGRDGELVEELAAIYVLLYSFRVLSCSKRICLLQTTDQANCLPDDRFAHSGGGQK